MKQSNIKIAITGGIGSGKTTVCNIIKEAGYPVYSCDEVYSELLESGNLTKELVNCFGEKILNCDGAINRHELSKIVFTDLVQLKKLNEITHPKVFAEIFKRAEVDDGLIFFEVPLLFESNSQNFFDGVIVILREEEERIKSIKLRSGLSEKEIKNRINSQYNYKNNTFAQYYVIHNDVNINELKQKIDSLLLKITKDHEC